MFNTFCKNANVFSSKLDYGNKCFLRAFKIKVSVGAQPIQLRSYCLNRPYLNKPRYPGYLAVGIIQHPASPWFSPMVSILMESVGIRHTMKYQKVNKVMEIPQIAISGSDEVLDTLESGCCVFSGSCLFSGFTQLEMLQPCFCSRRSTARPLIFRDEYVCPKVPVVLSLGLPLSYNSSRPTSTT